MAATATPVTYADAATYLAADKATKAALRKVASDAVRTCLRASDFPGAMAAQAALDTYVTPSAASATPRSEADLWRVRCATAGSVAATVYAASVAAGFEVDIDLDDADEARVTKIVSSITRMGTSTDVAQVILGAFDGNASGRLTVAQIVASAGDAAPSSGAVAARLTGKITGDLAGKIIVHQPDASHRAMTVSMV